MLCFVELINYCISHLVELNLHQKVNIIQVWLILLCNPILFGIIVWAPFPYKLVDLLFFIWCLFFLFFFFIILVIITLRVLPQWLSFFLDATVDLRLVSGINFGIVYLFDSRRWLLSSLSFLWRRLRLLRTSVSVYSWSIGRWLFKSRCCWFLICGKSCWSCCVLCSCWIICRIVWRNRCHCNLIRRCSNCFLSIRNLTKIFIVCGCSWLLSTFQSHNLLSACISHSNVTCIWRNNIVILRLWIIIFVIETRHSEFKKLL